jgi:hypothetical protein
MGDTKVDESLVLVRSMCFFCGTYGRCVIGKGFDGRELFVGVDCGCTEKAIEKKLKLKEEGSPHASYC